MRRLLHGPNLVFREERTAIIREVRIKKAETVLLARSSFAGGKTWKKVLYV